MAQTNALSQSVQAIIARHKAVEGTKVGLEAFNELKTISNADPEEAIFLKGDKFTVPTDLESSTVVVRLGTSKVPAVAVDMADGTAKLLYLTSLRKRVTEYEEDAVEGFKPRRDAAGAVITHTAGTELYTQMKNMPTAEAIAQAIAGKTFEVVDVLGPFQTSRIGEKKDAYGQTVRGVVGLRNTNIPVFEQK